MMKVLVATIATQGQRKNDFSFVSPGELLFEGSRCDSGTVDDACGCRRSLVGVKANKSTTTMRVIEWSGTPREWIEMVTGALVRGAWGSETKCRGDAKKLLARMRLSLRSMPVGAVVELRDHTLVSRRLPAAK